MESTLSGITNLNNRGTQHLYNGQWQEAISSFLFAIRSLRHASFVVAQHLIVEQDMIRPLEIITIATPISTILSTCLRQQQLDHNVLMVSPVVFQINLPTNNGTTTTIVSQQMVPLNNNEAENEELLNMLSATILYNLSFAYHAYAIVSHGEGMEACGENYDYHHHHHQVTNSECYEKALRIYGMAATIAQRAPSLLMERHPLFMTIYNNRAHASFQLLDMTTCNQCQEVLQRLISLGWPSTITENLTAYNMFLSSSAVFGGMINEASVERQQLQQVVHMNLILLQRCMRSAPAA